MNVEQFNKEKLTRKINKKKIVSVNLRITKNLSKWLKEKNYSPTAIFGQSCEILGYNGKHKKTD